MMQSKTEFNLVHGGGDAWEFYLDGKKLTTGSAASRKNRLEAKDILLLDDPQKDEFIEIFKTPPILPVELKKILKRQANYILANTSPWTDSFVCADTFLHEFTHLSAPSGGAPEARKSRRQEGKPTPANS